ncbi:tol-pal system protein YbgF [Halomonas caseinilytica]|uniref:tol-pal system protein YbgF n=1 Tax=Halomonas caseinilytica TaxID=438744 RepID=UPI0007E55ABB|nr:tol-pal system protein YbgF [Halomonas caseinilytica]SEM22519.1 tol-pal system protein YbgF [Halomonas caseinilytica]
MRQGLKRLCTLGIFGLPLAVSLPAVAQQPVVRDLSAGNSNFYDQAATREEAGGSLVLFNRVQRNQEELRRLRGQVEELRYQLEQLRKQTRQQYMDIEDRLTSAEAGASSSASSEPSPDASSARDAAAASSSSSGASAGNDAAGREAYQAAFAKVQDRDFGAARQAFEDFIEQYPDSDLTANAHYWLGELHSAESELDAAAEAFRRVIEDFPDSNKVPDALYKLGLLKARQGDPEGSRELLDRVQEEFPDSSAASLADDFLRQSGN